LTKPRGPPWLHVTSSSSGTGNALLTLTFDANPGATRTGFLNVAGQRLDVIQAGSSYVAVSSLATLVSSGLSLAGGVAVDVAGNV